MWTPTWWGAALVCLVLGAGFLGMLYRADGYPARVWMSMTAAGIAVAILGLLLPMAGVLGPFTAAASTALVAAIVILIRARLRARQGRAVTPGERD
jgi:hypothetical protein